MNWHDRDDWKQGTYASLNHDVWLERHNRGLLTPEIDTEHILDTFTLLSFSHAVSAPVEVSLDDSVAEHGLAYLVTSDHPKERPAYVRVLQINENKVIDPDEWRLDAILKEKEAAA